MGVTAIIGAQHGSEGKGVIVAKTAHKFHAAVRTGGPNAGHTFKHRGEIYKMRSIPCAWINPNCELIIGAGAVIDPEVLAREEAFTGRTPWIDHQAVVILPEDREAEENSALTKMGSTLEGVGAARIKKIRRDVDAPSPLARDYYPGRTIDTVDLLWKFNKTGRPILLEGTQGSGLSLNHGSWPHVTSADTNAAQFLADAGLPPSSLHHTLLVARTLPIRVGGPSGPMANEISWEELGVKPERTTVTNKIRRISTWDEATFRKAVKLNDPCGIVLTFLDYIDPGVTATPYAAWVMASPPVREFIEMVESTADTPVVSVGTGGEDFEVVPLLPCKHGDTW